MFKVQCQNGLTGILLTKEKRYGYVSKIDGNIKYFCDHELKEKDVEKLKERVSSPLLHCSKCAGEHKFYHDKYPILDILGAPMKKKTKKDLQNLIELKKDFENDFEILNQNYDVLVAENTMQILWNIYLDKAFFNKNFKKLAEGTEGIIIKAPPDKDTGKTKYVIKIAKFEIEPMNGRDNDEKTKNLIEFKTKEINKNNKAASIGYAPEILNYTYFNDVPKFVHFIYIMEYVEGSTVYKWNPLMDLYNDPVTKKPNEQLEIDAQTGDHMKNANKLMAIVFQKIFDSIEFLHSNDILHGDLNYSNIIVQYTGDYDAKVTFIDFSESTVTDPNQRYFNFWNEKNYDEMKKNLAPYYSEESVDALAEKVEKKILRPLLDFYSMLYYISNVDDYRKTFVYVKNHKNTYKVTSDWYYEDKPILYFFLCFRSLLFTYKKRFTFEIDQEEARKWVIDAVEQSAIVQKIFTEKYYFFITKQFYVDSQSEIDKKLKKLYINSSRDREMISPDTRALNILDNHIYFSENELFYFYRYIFFEKSSINTWGKNIRKIFFLVSK